MPQQGGAESGALGADTFAEALNLISKLPLSDAAWIGNPEWVAQNHYLQVTDSHFAQAVTEPEQAAQNPAQSVAVWAGRGRKRLAN